MQQRQGERVSPRHLRVISARTANIPSNFFILILFGRETVATNPSRQRSLLFYYCYCRNVSLGSLFVYIVPSAGSGRGARPGRERGRRRETFAAAFRFFIVVVLFIC